MRLRGELRQGFKAVSELEAERQPLLIGDIVAQSLAADFLADVTDSKLIRYIRYLSVADFANGIVFCVHTASF